MAKDSARERMFSLAGCIAINVAPRGARRRGAAVHAPPVSCFFGPAGDRTRLGAGGQRVSSLDLRARVGGGQALSAAARLGRPRFLLLASGVPSGHSLGGSGGKARKRPGGRIPAPGPKTPSHISPVSTRWHYANMSAGALCSAGSPVLCLVMGPHRRNRWTRSEQEVRRTSACRHG